MYNSCELNCNADHKTKRKMKYVFQKPLGDAVLRARGESKLTQSQVAAMIEKDSRTVLNIEKYEGNPKLEVLYPLVRSLEIDRREILYPEQQLESPSLRRLRTLIDSCNEYEAMKLVPVVESLLTALHTGTPEEIK